MPSRRQMLISSAGALAGIPLLLSQPRAEAAGDAPAVKAAAGQAGYTPVETPNGSTLPWTMEGGVKVYRLVAEPVKREFAPGMTVNCWGYNGQTPGPTIEAVEGDRVRLLVTNHLPEPTSVHWHGLLIPFGMDGVGGLSQRHIQPGDTYAYEFTLRQHGTYMYHPHSDEMIQMALGMVGFFIVHPRAAEEQRIDRDFAIFLNEWYIEPGTATPNPNIMLDFNTFTFNCKAYPATAPLVARTGQRVRIRLGNLSMDNHPIHIHGHYFHIAGTDGGRIPLAARWPETTVDVPVGSTREIEFVADNPGDWPLHCHKTHHAMNAMSHDVANMLGVDQSGAEAKVRALLPGYMAMGETGMGADMSKMAGPPNTLPMMSGEGPFGNIQMGGMFTLVKIRDGISSYEDPGWYAQPKETSALRVDDSGAAAPVESVQYTCPMHPQIITNAPGHCPICNMTLIPLHR